jgi:hypothetical protein
VDKRIININRYLGGFPQGRDPGTFSVWGGEGSRGRFALPVWRAIHILDGDRGGIVQLPLGEDGPRPLFLLDLAKDPARVDCAVELLNALLEEEAPALAINATGEMAVLLGADAKGSWFLQVWGRGSENPLDGKKRETLLFLAGECAGLLFFRELSQSGT